MAGRIALLVAGLLAAVLTVGGLVRSVMVDGRLPAPVPNAMVEANEHLQQGRWRAAADQYATVVSISPGDRPAWFYLGVALAILGDRDALVDAYRRARRVQPEMAVAVQQGAAMAENWRGLTVAERARIHRGGS